MPGENRRPNSPIPEDALAMAYWLMQPVGKHLSSMITSQERLKANNYPHIFIKQEYIKEVFNMSYGDWNGNFEAVHKLAKAVASAIYFARQSKTNKEDKGKAWYDESDGSNLMQPRRIDVGNVTYDGISGEIIRHHILENFVDVCRSQNIDMLPLSEGLHPDRGPIGIRSTARNGNANNVTLDSSNLFQSVRSAVKKCAILDVGGFLAAWKDAQGGANAGNYVAEKDYIDRECAQIGNVDPVKRDSCFDVAWLISESPQDLTITQHSAFRDTASMNSRYAQTMRSNTYGGVIRADLHRIGTDDYWYLQEDKDRLAIAEGEQKSRQKTLVEAIINFIASPTGAKTSGWAPHLFLVEGAILLTSARTAPFASPIKVTLNDKDNPVQADPSYVQAMKGMENNTDTWVWQYKNTQELLTAIPQITSKL